MSLSVPRPLAVERVVGGVGPVCIVVQRGGRAVVVPRAECATVS